MSFIGMKYPVFAPIEEELPGQLPVYGTGIVVGQAIAANLTLQRADNPLAADDTIIDHDNSVTGGTITCEIADLTDEVQVTWFGDKSVTEGEQTVIRSAAHNNAPEGGFGYIRVRRIPGGVRTFVAYWIFKTKWGVNTENAQTKPSGALEWQNPSAEGRIMILDDADGTWRDKATFTNEAAARAWLNAKANIPPAV